MTHHLVDGHGAPTRLILRRQLRQSMRYRLPFAQVLQGLHKLTEYGCDDIWTASCRRSHQTRRWLRSNLLAVLSFPHEGRVPHISLVFREMWDSTALSL